MWRNDAHVRAQRRNEKLEKAGECNGLLTQALKAGFLEDRERADQRRRRKYRWIADLPAGSTRRGTKAGLHLKTSGELMPPPACEPRSRSRAHMALVNETTSYRTWPRIQIFIAAPDGEIRVVRVHGERGVPNGVRQIEACRAAHLLCGAYDAIAIE